MARACRRSCDHGAVPRVVIAGLGDAGLLTAIHLSSKVDVVGISAKPGLVSGQELGMRLARPAEWTRDYWVTFDRFRKLDRARTVHGTITGVDPQARTIAVRTFDGAAMEEPFDVLVIATGVSNGFWRQPSLQSVEQIDAGLQACHDRLAAAGSVAVVGGGATAVSTAFNVAASWPDKQVHLHFPGDRALSEHHPKVWDVIATRLERLGVRLHPGHRAVVPAGFELDAITSAPVSWSTGQPDSQADAVIWAVGRVRPNTRWLPPDWLDDNGFVRVDEFLRVAGLDHVYAIGDVAATGPLRNSARGRADGLLARNIVAALKGKPPKPFREAPRRWGSVVGTQNNVLEVFSPTGKPIRIPGWSRWQPWLVRRAIYKGIRDA
jgi:NADH dehydrogenase FAD-containing subunit